MGWDVYDGLHPTLVLVRVKVLISPPTPSLLHPTHIYIKMWSPLLTCLVTCKYTHSKDTNTSRVKEHLFLHNALHNAGLKREAWRMLSQCSVDIQNHISLFSLLFDLVASKQLISFQILIFSLFRLSLQGGGVGFHSPDRMHFLFTYLG